MKLKKLNFILFGLIVIACCFGCNPPEFTIAQIKSLKKDNFILNPGDCFAFKADSENYFVAIYIDYTHEKNESWCEFWFTDYYSTVIPEFPEISKTKIVGHKVGSQFEKKGYFIGQVFEGLPINTILTSLNKIQLIGNIKIDKTKIRLGIQGASGTYSKFIEAYLSHRERVNKSVPEKSGLFPWPDEEYFPLNDFLIDTLMK